MGHLLADERFHKAACIWFTPIITVEWLRSRIEQIHPPSLFIIGTEDQFYQPELLKQLEKVTGGNSLVIEEIDHSLEIPGDIPKSLMVLNQIVQRLHEFFN